MTSPLPAPTVPVVLAVLGWAAGAAARRLLRRIRRGARVPRPWCEAGAAVAWGTTGVAAGLGTLPLRWLPVLLALGWLAVAAGAVDVLHHRLPDALTLPALPFALVLLVPLGPAAVLRGAVGAAVAVAAYAAVHLVAPAALGAGDVKLAAPLGAVLAGASWEALALGGVLAALLTGLLAAGVLAVGPAPGGGASGRGASGRGASGRGASGRGAPGRGARGAGALPHGPSMLLAGWLVATAAGCGARGP